MVSGRGVRRSVVGRPGGGDEAPTDPPAAAREICLRLLTVRPRTRAELAAVLHRRGIPDDAAEQVLDRLDEVGLVNDSAFAETFVRSGHAHRGLGPRALTAELRRRGVTAAVAREAVSTVGREDEEQRARELVRRRLRGSTPREETTLVRRLVSMLARKGYPEGLSYHVVRDELRRGGVDAAALDELTASE